MYLFSYLGVHEGEREWMVMGPRQADITRQMEGQNKEQVLPMTLDFGIQPKYFISGFNLVLTIKTERNLCSFFHDSLCTNSKGRKKSSKRNSRIDEFTCATSKSCSEYFLPLFSLRFCENPEIRFHFSRCSFSALTKIWRKKMPSLLQL